MTDPAIGKLHVEEVGSGEPVILLHSHGLSGRQWRRLADELVAHGRRAVMVDLSGQGRSDPWPEPTPFSIDIDVARVAELVNTVRPAHVVGHSYGGLVALQVARAHPGAIRTLSLFDPVAFGVLDAQTDRDAVAVLDRADLTTWGPHTEDRERWLRAFVEFWGGAGAWDALRGDARDEFRRVAWVVREGVRTLSADRSTDATYAGLDAPAVVMTGELSPTPAQRVVDHLARTLRHARHVVVPHVGHLGPVTNAQDVNPHILETIRRV